MLEYSLLYSCRITKSLKKLCELVEQLEGTSGHFMFHIFINYLDGGAELTLSKFQVLESRQKRLILVGLPDWGRLEKWVLGNLRGFNTGKCPLLCTRTGWGMSGWQGSHPCVWIPYLRRKEWGASGRGKRAQTVIWEILFKCEIKILLCEGGQAWASSEMFRTFLTLALSSLAYQSLTPEGEGCRWEGCRGFSRGPPSLHNSVIQNWSLLHVAVSCFA